MVSPAPNRAETPDPTAPTTDRRRLIEMHEAASAFYRDHLRGAPGAGPRAYLAHRHVDPAVAEPSWTIGYAPPRWTRLLTHLNEAGFGDREILAAGLAVETRSGSLIDRFRDRITFGIRNGEGELVGFTGRCSPAAANCPKYINSPRTALFAKGALLFGLAEQADRLRVGATPVLVEGPFDVLAVAGQDPERAAISTCGTALTRVQARLLRDASGGGVVVAFDGDQAGRKAARTAYHHLGPLFDQVMAASLPDDHDPSSLGQNDPATLRQALLHTGPLADRVIDDALAHYADRLDNAEARVCALHESTRLIARLAPDDVGRQVARVADRLGFPVSEVTRDLTEAVGHKSSTTPRKPSVIHRESSRIVQVRTTRAVMRRHTGRSTP